MTSWPDRQTQTAERQKVFEKVAISTHRFEIRPQIEHSVEENAPFGLLPDVPTLGHEMDRPLGEFDQTMVQMRHARPDPPCPLLIQATVLCDTCTVCSLQNSHGSTPPPLASTEVMLWYHTAPQTTADPHSRLVFLRPQRIQYRASV